MSELCWCACFQEWRPTAAARTCVAGGCPELLAEIREQSGLDEFFPDTTHWREP